MNISDMMQSRLNLLSMNKVNSNETNSAESNTINTQNSAVSFLDTLKAKLDDVNNQQIEADMATESLVKGDNLDIHSVMLTTEEAKLSLQLAVQIRNKLLDAYQELNRMQL